MDEWSGTSQGWRRESFPVFAGNRTFRWVYTKDGSSSGGADCAWLDNVIFPPPVTLTIWAGPDDKVCEGDDFTINEAFGTDYETVEWTTEGTGTFDDPTIINTLYIPGSDDITNGEVMLTLKLWDDENEMVQDEMVLSFKTSPEPPPAAQGPDYVDLLVTQASKYNTDGLEGISEYQWYLLPEDAGTIEGSTTSATVTWNPEYLGTANVSLAGINACGEGAKSESFEVTVDNTVGVNNPDEGNTGITIAPNPSAGIFYLSISDGDAESAQIRIFSILGKEIFHQELSIGGQARKSLDLSQWPDGVYFLGVEMEDRIVSEKIIKK